MFVQTSKVVEPVLDAAGFNTGRESHADRKDLVAGYDSFRELSDEAGEFFSNLIPLGIRKPEDGKTAGPDSYPTQLARENEHAISDVENFQSRWKREYQENKRKVLEGTIFGERKPYEGSVRESEASDGVVRQERSRAIAQGGGLNIVYERVQNYIHKGNALNEGSADLILQNVDTGAALDLNSLLPLGWKFIPSGLLQRKFDDPRGAADIVKDGNESSDFCAVSNLTKGFFRRRDVAYGDLSEKGHLLVLFHEIAHAWQVEYLDRSSSGRFVFEELYNNVYDEIASMNVLMHSPSARPEDFVKHLDNLDALGVKIYHDGVSKQIFRPTPVIKENIINIPAYFIFEGVMTKGYYPVGSVRLTQALDGYIADERDAWAHALKTMRFLREKGIDIAPELASLKDVEDEINPCLESYQSILDVQIGPRAGRSFIRHSPPGEISGSEVPEIEK